MSEFPSPEEIIRVFEGRPERTFRLREIVEELGLRSSQARRLRSVLRELAKRRQITQSRKNHFAWASRSRLGKNPGSMPTARKPGNFVTGRLVVHREGFGFLVVDHLPGSPGEDVFIPPGATKDAMHGDRVEAQIIRSPKSGARASRSGWEGAVVRVLDRAQKTVVGEFHHGPRYNYVTPFDPRVRHEIVIPRGQERPAARRPHRQFGGESQPDGHGSPRSWAAPGELEGVIVDVEITRFPTATSFAHGRVIEILGRRDEFGVDVEIIIRKFHLPHRFSDDVLEEADASPQIVSAQEGQGCVDFRMLPIVTIDGETAKDFDDAVYVERAPNGHYRLQVHIADVAHYVWPGSAIDREARLRGTSVYFPDRAVPMLPLELSNGICSLNPHVDRLVMSVVMELDGTGECVECRFVPGIIRSAERMTYTAVHAVLTSEESARRRYAPLVGSFKLMEELAGVLRSRREARGSIDFDLPEPEIEFDAMGQMIGIARAERNVAHRIIEEFMLAANEAVASFLDQHRVRFLYRIHEKPDPKKVLEFEEIASSFGYSLGVERPTVRRVRLHDRPGDRNPRYQDLVETQNLKITSRHYQRLTQRIAGKPEERILSYLMLRSLKQARYAEENQGHFALASSTYTHFTSPIRRYPDLVVHRALKVLLQANGGSAGFRPRRSGTPESRAAGLEQEALGALALETSEAERRAAEAERELMDWKKVDFMASRIGDEFDALIISLTRHGFFVELMDLFVEGFVPIDGLNDPGWVYRERLRAWVNRDSKQALRLGEHLTVRLDRIDRTGNKLIFGVAERRVG
jgi:ribonuclease R